MRFSPLKINATLKKDWPAICAGLIIIIVFSTLSFKKFSDQCLEYSYEATINRLAELSAHNVDGLYLELNTALQYVRNSAAAFAVLDGFDSPEASELLSKALEFSDFNRIWLVDSNNVGRDRRGHLVEMRGGRVFNSAREGQSGILMSRGSSYSKGEIFLIYAPVVRQGQFAGYLLGVYDIQSLIAQTATPQFNGLGYTHVFDMAGESIIRSENPDSIIGSGNVWDFFRGVVFDNGGSYEKLRDDIINGRQGSVSYQSGGQVRMGHYAPVGVNDWYMMSVVSGAVVKEYSRSMDRFAFELVMKLVSCFAALLLGLVFYAGQTGRRIMSINNLLRISNQRFRVAAFQASHELIEFDIPEGTIYKIVNGSALSEERAVSNLSMDLIKDRTIESESLYELNNVLEYLRNGSKAESCVVEAVDAHGRPEWYQLMFTNIFNDQGQAVRAIGTIENISERKRTEIKFSQEKQHRQVVMAEMLETSVFNITTDRFLYGYRNDKYQGAEEGSFYYHNLRHRVWQMVHPDDRQMVMDAFSPEKLKSDYRQGLTAACVEFRAADESAGEKWFSCTINVAVDPDSKGLIGYSYVKDITAQKLQELSLKSEAERDGLTGLYNRHAVEKLISEQLAKKEEGILDAFIILDLDKFKYINDTYGHAAGDEALKLMADNLTRLFRKSDIMGRMGGDEFIIFLHDVKSVEMLEKRAGSICASLRDVAISADPAHRISGSVGVYIVSAPGEELSEVYAKADEALYAAKDAGKDCYRIYDPAAGPSRPEK
ncbi:hypothetical protein C4J81_00195 [Deltaproteobacteria bacterium Smac51]|nr:hypothetical protein C4J81_00195 [Deltaproteobacteria bacterium Smac51]